MRSGWLVILTLLVSPSLTIGAQEQVVQEVSTNGTRTLRPITLEDNWEIRWRTAGETLTIYVYDEKDETGLLPSASQDGPGQGATYRHKGGRYYLRILAKGDWTVTVIQLP
jgi:hypothetical protein